MSRASRGVRNAGCWADAVGNSWNLKQEEEEEKAEQERKQLEEHGKKCCDVCFIVF